MNPASPARMSLHDTNMQGRRVVVTGAAGFIGSHLCGALVNTGARVVGVDNLEPFYDPALKRANLLAVAGHAEHAGAGTGPTRDASSPLSGLDAVAAFCRREEPAFAWLLGDITDEATMHGLLAAARPWCVVHLAAKAGVRPSIADPPGYARANVLGTSVTLDAARRAGCERVVVASSSSVYGNTRVQPGCGFREDMPVDEPISPYAATKRACEVLAYTHHHLTGMPTACLRFFTVYGPRQRPDLAISSFLRRIAAGEVLRVFGDGTTSRDYTYVDDIVDGVLAAMSRIDRHGFRVWNLGGNRPVTLSDMIATIGRVVGREPRVEHGPMQPGDVDHTAADLTRANAELGYTPRTDFAQGVARQWAWMRAQ